jgi:hypothetical protein
MKTCIKCGSHAFNLHAEEIDQGGLCDVHYWQGRAHRAEALEQPEQEPVAWEQFYPDIGKPQLKQEPVGFMNAGHVHEMQQGRLPYVYVYPKGGVGADIAVYTTPPKRPWVGLTDEQIWKFWSSRPEVPEGEDDSMEAEFVAAVRRVLAAHGIGAKLKEKNT